MRISQSQEKLGYHCRLKNKLRLLCAHDRKNFRSALSLSFSRLGFIILGLGTLSTTGCGRAVMDTQGNQNPDVVSEQPTEVPPAPEMQPGNGESTKESVDVDTPASSQDQIATPNSEVKPSPVDAQTETNADSDDPKPKEPEMQQESMEQAVSAPAEVTAHCLTELPSQFPIGFSDHCIKIANLERIYRVFRPSQIKSTGEIKGLVFALHGGSGSAENASDSKRHALGVFKQVAERESFVLIYPQGTPDSSGKNGWNDCRSDDLEKSDADDVGFLAKLIESMSARFHIASSRVFLTGTSNGAMMAYRFAMEKSALVGALATSSGNIAANPVPGRCSLGPEKPVPILMTHGTDDPIVPTEGGHVACIGPGSKDRCTRGTVKSAAETVEFWLRQNGLDGARPVTQTVDSRSDDPGPAIESRYVEVVKVAAAVKVIPKVVSWQLMGAGHSVPSFTVDLGNVVVGTQNKDIEFAEEAWSFFKSQM